MFDVENAPAMPDAFVIASCDGFALCVVPSHYGGQYYGPAAALPWLYCLAALGADGVPRLISSRHVVPLASLLSTSVFTELGYSADDVPLLDACRHLPPDLTGASSKAVAALGIGLKLSGPFSDGQAAALDNAAKFYRALRVPPVSAGMQ